MKVFGIDPGSNITGYGVVEEDSQGILKSIDFGAIKTSKNFSFPEKIKYIYDNLYSLIKNHSPDVVVVEEIFFAKNAKSTIKLGQTRGAILVCAANLLVEIEEYSALKVKQSIVGYGRAEKTQVRDMVKRILHLKTDPKPLDASDALAIAICHLNTYKFSRKIKSAARTNQNIPK